jgi:hypothetical protein
MSITHEEARKFIQFNADHALKADDLTMLDAHLAACQACTAHAEQIRSMELTLRQTMRKQWNAPPLPLRVQDVRGKNWLEGWTTALLPTRKLLIGITTLLFAFTVWQFAASGGDSSNMTMVVISPNPTPSLSTTSTHSTLNSCDLITYTVQDGDTLKGLADRYSVPAEAITELNNLKTSILAGGSQIIIPLCTLTPTSTNHAPASTLTPGLQTFTTTPG